MANILTQQKNKYITYVSYEDDTIKILFTVQFAVATAIVIYTMTDYQISFISKKKKKTKTKKQKRKKTKAQLKENW